MFTLTLTNLLTLALTALTATHAISITSPTEGQLWSSTGSQTVSWTSVVSDPSSFAITFVNDNQLTTSLVTLVQNQSTSAGSVSVSPPSGSWPSGSGFRINFVQSSQMPNAILAQSPQFNISSSASGNTASASSSSMSASSSSSGMVTSMVSTPSASIGAASTTASGSAGGGESSTYSGNASGIPPAQTSTGAASKTFIPSPVALGAVAGPVVAGLVAVVAGFKVLA